MFYKAYIIGCLMHYQIYNCLLAHPTNNLVNYSHILPLSALKYSNRLPLPFNTLIMVIDMQTKQ